MEIQETALTEEHLSMMNEAQRKIVLTQWQKHQHEDIEVDYDVSGEGDMLNRFLIKKGVWNPFLASGRYHARYLFYHTNLYQDKTVIEIGSGTGLMGIVMAKHGANKVIMSDISQAAVENSRENVIKYGLEERASVVQGDLFENIEEKADMITWMIPFFPGTTERGDTISASMIMPPELFERFLQEAKQYLNYGGIILLPSFSLGGELTDPAIFGREAGYRVETTWTHNSINGIQRGLIYMHELKIPDKFSPGNPADPEYFSNAFKMAHDKYGLSITTLSDEFKINRGTVERYMRGQSLPGTKIRLIMLKRLHSMLD